MKALFSAAAAALIATPAAAGDGLLKDRFAVSGSAGTLGGQLEAHAKLNRFLSVRGGANYLEFDFSETYEEVDYDLTADLTGGLFAIDFHPLGSGLVVSAGAHFGGKAFDLTGTPTGTVEIGDTTYTAAEAGTLTGEADLGGTAPYLGVGWNGAFSGGRIGLTAMLGALLLEDPTVDLSADGTLASDPTFQAELEEEERRLQDDLDEYPFWPVASIGVVVRF